MNAYAIVIAEMASFSTVMTIDGKISRQEHVHYFSQGYQYNQG